MNHIIVYTQDECPPCQVVKMFLTENRISFSEKNITSDIKAKEELINNYKSYSTPTVIIGQEIVTGFNLERLKELLHI